MGVRGISLSFVAPRFLIIENENLYTVDDLTEEILLALTEDRLRIINIESTPCQVLADGSSIEIPDIDDVENYLD